MYAIRSYYVFPVPFRKLNYDSQYEKWRWIEWDLVRNTKDFRPESYRPENIERDIKILDKVDSKHWDLRRNLVLNTVYYNLEELISKAKNKNDRTRITSYNVCYTKLLRISSDARPLTRRPA